jgi:hypothetical protein
LSKGKDKMKENKSKEANENFILDGNSGMKSVLIKE